MNIETHSSIWGYKVGPRKDGQHTHGAEDLDMERNRIINLGKPNKAHHAATMSYVMDVASHKVNVSGDTLEGNLDMNYNKITSVGEPVDETDVVNKQYVDGLIQNEHDLKPYDMGRYIVFPHTDSTKAYFSVRSRKNIDLKRGKMVEIKHNIADSTENEFSDDIFNIRKDITLLPNPDKDLGIIQLNTELLIRYEPPSQPINVPCTFLFSARSGDPPPDRSIAAGNTSNESFLTFINTEIKHGPRTFTIIKISWALNEFRYTIGNSIQPIEVYSDSGINTAQFNHVGLQFFENKLNIWLNGKQINQYYGNFVLLNQITVGVKELGIVSLYNRGLNKMEMIQHFVDHHVENFTNDEVLI